MGQFPTDSICPPTDDEYDEDFAFEFRQELKFRRGNRKTSLRFSSRA